MKLKFPKIFTKKVKTFWLQIVEKEESLYGTYHLFHYKTKNVQLSPA